MAATISSSNAKVEIHRTISSLPLDNPSAAWELLKSSLEKKIGKFKYICVPYITSDDSFDVTTVFVKIEQTGRPGLRNRTYKTLGKVENILNREKSFEMWHDISDRVPDATPFDIQTPFEVVVRDDVNHICVSTVFRDFTKQLLPSEFVARKTIQLDSSLSPELETVRKIYMIDEIVLSRNIEIRIHVGEDARSFFRDGPHTVAFHYKKYKLNVEKQVQRAMRAKINSLRTTWHRASGHEDQDSGFVSSSTRPSSVFAINRIQSKKSSMAGNENEDEASVDTGSFNKNANATDGGKSQDDMSNIPLADDDPQAIIQDDLEGVDMSNASEAMLRGRSFESIPSTFTNGSSSPGPNSLDPDISPDEQEEKARLISQVLELQNTLDDLSQRVDSVKEENLKLRSENQVLGQYIENLMSASSVFQSTSPKSKKK